MIFDTLDGICGILVGLVLLFDMTDLVETEGAEPLVQGILSGIFLGLGSICLYFAATFGPIGPTFAISHLMPALVMLAHWQIYDGGIPTSFQLISMGVVIFGAILISIG